jgi:Holliday junction resolvase RusA-like endonuclease
MKKRKKVMDPSRVTTCPSKGTSYDLYLEVDPVAASRPRVGRYATYYEGPYQDFRVWAKDNIPRIVDEQVGHITLVNTAVRLDIVFAVEKPASTKLDYPDPDIDNYLKAILDQLNLVLFDDDRCVVETHVWKEWAPPDSTGCISIVVNTLGPFSNATPTKTKRKARRTAAVPKVSKRRRRSKRK